MNWPKGKMVGRRWAGALVASAVLLLVAGCDGPSSEAPAKKDSGNAELFSIPADQMSHVQLLTVQPKSLARTLRLTGAVAYNSFRTTPVITQVSGPVSRILIAPGQLSLIHI